jgi:hypothetical protein
MPEDRIAQVTIYVARSTTRDGLRNPTGYHSFVEGVIDGEFVSSRCDTRGLPEDTVAEAFKRAERLLRGQLKRS